MASWIGLEILIPKHPWKSKIGLLQPILAAKRYVTFFLGHPVVVRNTSVWMMALFYTVFGRNKKYANQGEMDPILVSAT